MGTLAAYQNGKRLSKIENLATRAVKESVLC